MSISRVDVEAELVVALARLGIDPARVPSDARNRTVEIVLEGRVPFAQAVEALVLSVELAASLDTIPEAVGHRAMLALANRHNGGGCD